MDGHADNAPETGGLADLASFLTDTPETESKSAREEATPDEELDPTEDTEEASNAQEEDSDEESDEDTPDDEEAEDTPPPERKVKVTVKGDDGTDQELEVDETELIKGYHRQADYTRKMQALSERENQAVQTLVSKHQEIQADYLDKAEKTRAAIVSMAGIRSADEMAQLAQSDPAAWVAENQRQQSIAQYLNQLDAQISAEKQRLAADQEARQKQVLAQMAQASWAELSKEKIDKPALQKIYTDAMKTYGFTPEELSNVYDHRIVKALRDAAAYQALKSQKAEVTKKVEQAPRLPSKTPTTRDERQTKALNDRFKGGRAKLNDLASFLR